MPGRRIAVILAGVTLALFVITGLVGGARQLSAQDVPPRLVNGGFEGNVIEHSQRVIVAEGWTPIYWDREPMIGGGSPGRSAQPEYKPLTVDVDPYRVRSGEQSQCWFWFYTHGDAAIWQRVRVPAGYYRVDVWAQAWVSDRDDNPHSSNGEMYISLGIDPEGRDPHGWPWETSVVWSPFSLVWNTYEQYGSRLVYVPKDGWITVYIRSWKKWSEKHGDVYLDDARLVRVDVANPTPEPLPTYTPYPTLEPCPTCVPGSGACDYARIKADVATVVAGREPVRWPR